jgi:hypothetical protein
VHSAIYGLVGTFPYKRYGSCKPGRRPAAGRDFPYKRYRRYGLCKPGSETPRDFSPRSRGRVLTGMSLVACHVEQGGGEGGLGLSISLALSLAQGKVILVRSCAAAGGGSSDAEVRLLEPPAAAAAIVVDTAEGEEDKTKQAEAKGGKEIAEGEGGEGDQKEGGKAAAAKNDGAPAKEEMEDLEASPRVSGLTFSPDGKLLAVAGPEKVIRVWEVETAEPRLSVAHALPRRPSCACFSAVKEGGSSSSSVVMVSDKLGDVWAVDPRAPASGGSSAAPQLILGHTSAIITCMCTVSEGSGTDQKRYVLTGDRNEQVRVSRFPATSIIQSFLMSHVETTTAVAEVGAGQGLAISAGLDGYLGLWAVATGERLAWVSVSNLCVNREPAQVEAERATDGENAEKDQRVYVSCMAVCPATGLIAAAVGSRSLILFLRASAESKSLTLLAEVETASQPVALAFAGRTRHLMAVVQGRRCLEVLAINESGAAVAAAEGVIWEGLVGSISKFTADSEMEVLGNTLESGLTRAPALGKDAWNQWKDRKYKLQVRSRKPKKARKDGGEEENSDEEVMEAAAGDPPAALSAGE